MNVLVVDDDRTTRFLLKRALTKRFGCVVTEAGDGNEALDALARGRFHLAILDVQMPIADGLQCLRTLRETPEYSALPVVMLTGERDEGVIREILELGVLEYMTKPLNMPRLAERIRRVLRCIGSDREEPPIDGDLLSRALLDATSPVLIVDGRTAFRTFFVETVGVRRPVIQAETGLRGLRDCVFAKPAAVFVGSDLGVLNERLLVKKIRTSTALRHLPIIALAENEEDADARLVLYDGTIIRTMVPDVLLKQIVDLSRNSSGPLSSATGLHPGLRATLILIAEQVLGSMLSTDVLLRDVPGPTAVERVVATAHGSWSGRPGVSLALAYDLATGRRVAGNLFGIDARMVRDETVDSAAQEAIAMISARLQATFVGSGLAVEFGEATTSRTVLTLPAEIVARDINMYFQSAAADLEFWLMLKPSASDN